MKLALTPQIVICLCSNPLIDKVECVSIVFYLCWAWHLHPVPLPLAIVIPLLLHHTHPHHEYFWIAEIQASVHYCIAQQCHEAERLRLVLPAHTLMCSLLQL